MEKQMIFTLLISFLTAFFLFPQPSIATHDFLSPLLSPVFNVCETAVCGEGNCRISSNNTFGFACECNRGWTQFHIADHLQFLPCVVPNCTFNSSCTRAVTPVTPSPATSPEPTNHSFFDPCEWAYCGEGSCQKTSTSTFFKHTCECNQGYSNLLNITSYPCFSECSLGAECADLGIGLTNRSATSASSPPSLSDSGNSENRACSNLPANLLWSAVLTISMAMVPWI
ncbi:uncharacterized protein LOC143881070 [Tasmannia lanceolata]|uniref:uncharacterized protein LOC143881070 n=1 Tax=Tasmannia lanceolata TaxID=3420 RepID=UPI004062C73F